MILDNLEPKNVFRFFEEISAIPRGSRNEKQISDYLYKFAKDRNLEVIQDEALNIIIKKDGTKGYENAPTVILQGHMDMVPEKNKGTNHDFKKDGLKLYIDGDNVRAKGTTLGADNGVAVAYSLAILDSDSYSHPPLEVVITTEEEVGLTGASALDTSPLKGKLLINLDMEEEGVFCVSCAGGARIDLVLPVEKTEITGYEPYLLNVRGFKGGHSGTEINTGVGNSIRALGHILFKIRENYDIYMKEISGGAQDNAIPREAEAVIFIKKSDKENIEKVLKDFESELRVLYKGIEENISVSLEENSSDSIVFTNETSDKIISGILDGPNGVGSMSRSIEDLVESSANLGVLKTDFENNQVTIVTSVRSSVETRKHLLIDQIKALGKALGGNITVRGEYPGWEYDENSELRKIFVNTYKDTTGKEPEILAIHAGLECGIFVSKIKGLDAIALGPTMYDVHTPEEALSISSTERLFKFVLKVLERIK